MHDECRRPERISFKVKMLTGVAATTVGAVPIGLRIVMTNLENVSGPEFIGPMVAFVLAFFGLLALGLVRLAHVEETDVGCMIARASLVPGSLNTIAFTASAFLNGGVQ